MINRHSGCDKFTCDFKYYVMVWLGCAIASVLASIVYTTERNIKLEVASKLSQLHAASLFYVLIISVLVLL